MKVQNNGEKFELTYNGGDIIVNTGLSQELPNNVARHIFVTATKWGNDVQLIDGQEKEIELLKKQIEQEKQKNKVDKEIKEEIKEDEQPKTTTKKVR